MAKFKVGDRVRAVKDGLSTKGAVGMLGFVRSVGLPGDTYPVQVEMDAGGTYESAAVSASYRWSYFNEDALELAAVAPATAALKVGDRVRISATEYSGDLPNTGTGTITKTGLTTRRGDIEVTIDGYGGNLSYHAAELTRLDEPAPTPIANTLGIDLNPPALPQVGDAVLIHGTIKGITQSLRGTNYNIVFETQNRRMSLHFLEDDFIVNDDGDECDDCGCADNDNGPLPFGGDTAKAFDAMGTWLRSLAVARAA